MYRNLGELQNTIIRKYGHRDSREQVKNVGATFQTLASKSSSRGAVRALGFLSGGTYHGL